MYLSKFSTSLNADNSLKLSISDNDGLSTAHIKSWKDGLGIKLINGKKSVFDILDHEMTLLNRAHNNNKDLPIHDFVKDIPDKYQKIAMMQMSQQYSMLRLFRFSPAAYDLYFSNKLLLCLVIFQDKSLFEVNKLLKKPQHEIVEVLYSNKKSELSYKTIVRMLKHRIIHFERQKDITRVHYFLTNLLSGELPSYNENNILHIKYIPSYLLNYEYLDFIFLLNPSLIFNPIKRELDNTRMGFKKSSNAHKKCFKEIIITAQDALYMAKELSIDEDIIRGRLYKANNPGLLNKFHDELTKESIANINDEFREDKEIPDLRLVEPPIPGTDNIIPLQAHSYFIDESNEMKHCLAYGEYVHDVYERRSYIYSVKTKDDRCTLELGIKGNNEFYIKQLQGYKNTSPRKDTLDLINKWLLVS